jgi:hypothetical protein
LDNAPAHALGAGTVFTAEEAHLIAKLPAVDVDFIAAVDAIAPFVIRVVKHF